MKDILTEYQKIDNYKEKIKFLLNKNNFFIKETSAYRAINKDIISSLYLS